MRYFVKFGYTGTEFTGYQRGNGNRSVEDEIITALEKMHFDPEISSAARTDRGVSAIGNVFSLNCKGSIRKAVADLNRNTQDMVFHAFAAVPDTLNPRHNESKVYRYIAFDMDRNALERRLVKFEGKHDFSGFARVDNRNPLRTIDKIEVKEREGYIAVDFHAKSFIWQQIRRIMGFVFYTISEGLDVDPFSGHKIVKLAPPGQLILMDVSYRDVAFTPFKSANLQKRLSLEATEARMDYIYRENVKASLYD